MVQDRVKCLITKIVLILMLFVQKFPKEIQKLKNTEIFNSIYNYYILYIYKFSLKKEFRCFSIR